MLYAAVNGMHIKRLNRIESQPEFMGTWGARGTFKAGWKDSVGNLEDLYAEVGNDDIDGDLAIFTDFVLGIQDWTFMD